MAGVSLKVPPGVVALVVSDPRERNSYTTPGIPAGRCCTFKVCRWR